MAYSSHFDPYFSQPRPITRANNPCKLLPEGQTVNVTSMDRSVTQWHTLACVHSDPDQIANVLFARDRQGHAAAIKLVGDPVSHEPEITRTLQSHRNVIEYIGAVTGRYDSTLVTRWAEFDTLEDFMGRHYESGVEIAEMAARTLFHDIVTGLAYINGRGYVHDDLSPRNVFLTGESGRVTAKLADFEYSRKVGQPIRGNLKLEDGTCLCVMLVQLSLTLDPTAGVHRPGFVDELRKRIPQIKNPQQQNLADKICNQGWSAVQILRHPWFGVEDGA